MIDALTRAAESWWGWIGPVSLQAAVLLALVAVLDRVLRRRAPARVRMALWLAALARLALPADLSSPASLTAPLAASLAGDAAAPSGGGAEALLLLTLWIAGALATAAFWILRDRAERRRLLDPAAILPASAGIRDALAAAARRAGLRRVPALAVSRAADGPCVLGTLRPEIVLPADSADGADLDAALLHECMHVRRGDPLARAIVRAAAALFWFHPLVHLAVRRTEALRETCCDASVAEVLGPATEGYRAALLRAAERVLRPGRARAPALGLLGGGDGLADRLRALEGRPWRGARARTAGAFVAGSFVLGCLAPMGSPGDCRPPGGRPTPGADAGSLAVAHSVLDAAERGERQSCWSVRFAGLRLAQEDGSLAGAAGIDSRGGRP